MQSVAWLPDAIPQSPSAQKLLPRTSNGYTAPHIRYIALSGAKTCAVQPSRHAALAKGDCHDADRFVVSLVGLIFATLSRPLRAAAIALLMPGVMTSHNVTRAW